MALSNTPGSDETHRHSGLKLIREDPGKINVCGVSKQCQSMYGKEMGYAALKALQYMFTKIRFNRYNENDVYIDDQNGCDCGIILLSWALLRGVFGNNHQLRHVEILNKYNYSRLMFAVAIDCGYWFQEDEQYVEDNCKVVIAKDHSKAHAKRVLLDNVDIISVINDDSFASEHHQYQSLIRIC
jgi:hypothetical protein